MTTHKPAPAHSRSAVDLHAHWTPPALARALRERRAIPRIAGPAGGEIYHSIYGQRPFTALETDLAARVAWMDGCGIRMQVLSLPGLFGIDSLPPAESLPLLRGFNDAAAAACRAFPGRFLALAALPHPDIALACGELRRALDLGLRGAILPADAFASLASAQRFRPLLSLADEAAAHLFIHPGPTAPPALPGTGRDAGDAPWLRHIVLATQSRLCDAMATLTLTDFLHPYARLTVQVANLGGAMPFYAERMDQVGRAQLGDTRPVSQRMRRCYVDTSSFGPRAIEMAVQCLGADRVVLGSDCPIFDAPGMLAAVMAARLGDEARALVLQGNAHRLFGLPTTQPLKETPHGQHHPAH